MLLTNYSLLIRSEVHTNIPHVMAQTTGLTSKADEARLEDNNMAAVNSCPYYEEFGVEVEATTAETLGCLQKYTTIKRLDLPLTLQLGRLTKELRDQL